MSPANQLPLYTEAAAKLGFYGAKPEDLMNQAIDTVQHEYAHNITKFPEFANVMKNTMDAGIPSGLQLKGKPGDGISKFDKEELFIRALDIERRFNKDKSLNSPNVKNDLAYMNQVLNKKYRNLNKNGQSMAIQYLNSIRPQVKDYFNTINQRATANRARAANPDVYARADALGFTDGRGGGFASKSTGTNENFSNKTGRGRTGYDDGGRVGLFMGGPALEGQALEIYNSMNSYGFSDQEIANALEGQGLYTPSGSSTPETTAPNIINQQLQTGGGGDNNFGGQGIGKFGNLDPNTLETMQVEVADGMGGTKIVEKETALTAGGLRRTLDNKNPVNAGIDVKPMAITIMEALMGKKTDSEFLPEGKILGTFNNPNYKDLSFFGKIKADYFRQKELKQLQKEFELQEKLKKQIAEEQKQAAFNQARSDRDRAISSGLDAAIKEGRDTSGFDRPSSGAYAEGAGMGVGGGYASDYGFLKDGGLATMFKKKR
jgi:serine/threonine protein phosphatase PrpC